MKDAGVSVRQRKKHKVTTNSNHKLPVFNNLLKRDFKVTQANKVYAEDITSIWTQEGWIYLLVVIDLYSRKVVGWSNEFQNECSLVCDVLKTAIWGHCLEVVLIYHSDQGSKYASSIFRNFLTTHGTIGSRFEKKCLNLVCSNT